MRNMLWIVTLLSTLTVLPACGDNSNQSDESDELKMLDVNFELPETADVDETIELKATVTYGDEKVDDADLMEFEYWKKGNRDDSTSVDGKNNGDGTYTTQISLDKDGIYEMYAHTTARALHTMPKKSITVGDVSEDELEENNNADES